MIPYPAGGYTNCSYGALFGANCTDATLDSLLGSCFVASNKSSIAPTSFGACLIGAIGDNINHYQNATTGAFTMEMLLNIDASLANTYYLINGDNGLSVRGWQWRIDGGATPVLEINGANTSGTDFKANLPTTGPDAIATNTWYHVAVTYTGTAPTNGDAVGVLTMYWTLVDPSRTNADILATFSTGNFLGPATPTFCIGADARSMKASNPQVYGGGSTLTQANCPGTGDAFDFESNLGEAPGYMAEARITDLCLRSNQMAFTAGVPYRALHPQPNERAKFARRLRADLDGTRACVGFPHAGLPVVSKRHCSRRRCHGPNQRHARDSRRDFCQWRDILPRRIQFAGKSNQPGCDCDHRRRG